MVDESINPLLDAVQTTECIEFEEQEVDLETETTFDDLNDWEDEYVTADEYTTESDNDWLLDEQPSEDEPTDIIVDDNDDILPAQNLFTSDDWDDYSDYDENFNEDFNEKLANQCFNCPLDTKQVDVLQTLPAIDDKYKLQTQKYKTASSIAEFGKKCNTDRQKDAVLDLLWMLVMHDA